VSISREGWPRFRCGGRPLAISITQVAAQDLQRRIMRQVRGITQILVGFGLLSVPPRTEEGFCLSQSESVGEFVNS
jgi:hypothetical protein